MRPILWTEAAKADICRLDKSIAMHIFYALHRFAELGEGDVKALEGRDEYRLRVGNYRVLFVATANRIEVRRVRHRSEVYR